MVTTKSMILDARIDKSNIPKVYQKIAPNYDIWGKLTESKAWNRCFELADILDGESVLEVAVGTGLAFVDILQSNFHSPEPVNNLVSSIFPDTFCPDT